MARRRVALTPVTPAPHRRSVYALGYAAHTIRMLSKYSTTIGAAKTVWFQPSVEGVNTAAMMKISRKAYWKLRHMNRAVTTRIRARKNASVGI